MSAFHKPIGITVIGNQVIVACDDGAIYLWGPRPPQTSQEAMLHTQAALGAPVSIPWEWRHFEVPVPGTERDAAYQEVR